MLADTYKRHNLEGGKKKNNPKDHTHTHTTSDQQLNFYYLLLTTTLNKQQTTTRKEKEKEEKKIIAKKKKHRKNHSTCIHNILFDTFIKRNKQFCILIDSLFNFFLFNSRKKLTNNNKELQQH